MLGHDVVDEAGGSAHERRPDDVEGGTGREQIRDRAVALSVTSGLWCKVMAVQHDLVARPVESPTCPATSQGDLGARQVKSTP